MDPSPCEFLPWDSEFFGLRVGRVIRRSLDPGYLDAVRRWRREQDVACLYFLASSDDPSTVRLAEDAGFRLVDVRITFQRPLDDLSPTRERRTIRPCTAKDLDALRAVARTNHRHSRFYFDERFAPERCDDLYGRWLEESLRGFADAVWVADHDGEVAGYLTVHRRRDGTGDIGLVGVSESARGRGVGSRLLEETLRWAASEGLSRMDVVTQGRNLGAQRFYQRQGFTTRSLELWYHGWSDEIEAVEQEAGEKSCP